MSPRWFPTLLILTMLLVRSAQAGVRDSLKVTVDGLRSTRDQVCLSLYDKPETFLMQPKLSLRTQCVKIIKTPMQVTFKNLAPGNYAIAALHDTNGTGKVERNFMGMPMEGFGFSRNPVVTMKAPKFDQAAVKVDGANTTLAIQMKYLPGAKS
ncbi:MAG: DUF2141 domain-containing protein [Aphanocapsa sp. GSE-SYN-MK-11-07L]|nr:DUF2141 domain-containing protein [Aphanocapsa sp. GSE-SYN-MK-11-07L]